MTLHKARTLILLEMEGFSKEEETVLINIIATTTYGKVTRLCDYAFVESHLDTKKGDRINLQQMTYLIDLLTTNPYHIKSLSFSRLVLTNGFIEKLTFYLENNMLPIITSINILSSDIGNCIALSFAKVLYSNSSLLKNLTICCNGITDEGAKEIAKSLYRNENLIWLALSCNYISDEGAIELAKCLYSNTALEYLDLGQNKIGNIGFAAICEALKVNQSLEYLKILHNEITNWELLIDALKYNFHIKNVCINHYSCSPDTYRQINILLSRNEELYQKQYWHPYRHISFPKMSIHRGKLFSIPIEYSCHNMLISSIVCNSEFSVILPMDVWKYIFSFFRRNMFNL